MINWYPGHMAKARRDIKSAMPKVDLVIEVLDARLPFSSENPLIAELRGDRPCIQILNKSDLADPDVTNAWLNHISKRPGIRAISHQKNQQKLTMRLLDVVKKLVPPVGTRPIAGMIMGIPNVGKSTIINALTGRPIAKTGNKPAVTKKQQRVKVSKGLILWDTPGFLWPKLSPEVCGYRLATSGAITDRILDAEEIAHFAARFLAERYPDKLKSKYGLTDIPQGEHALLEAIGRRRGFLRKGGIVDVDRASMTLLRDLRDGGLGGISLEGPADCIDPSEAGERVPRP